jgi:hypothetical protein
MTPRPQPDGRGPNHKGVPEYERDPTEERLEEMRHETAGVKERQAGAWGAFLLLWVIFLIAGGLAIWAGTR